jgi:hypothetical protein
MVVWVVEGVSNGYIYGVYVSKLDALRYIEGDEKAYYLLRKTLIY